MFNSFHMIAEKRENSIFCFACISDNIEEFNSQKIVKIDIINIDIRVIFELYHGIIQAIDIAKNIIIIHKISLRVIMFQTILEDDFSSLLISLTAIVYNHKSARKANIHKQL